MFGSPKRRSPKSRSSGSSRSGRSRFFTPGSLGRNSPSLSLPTATARFSIQRPGVAQFMRLAPHSVALGPSGATTYAAKTRGIGCVKPVPVPVKDHCFRSTSSSLKPANWSFRGSGISLQKNSILRIGLEWRVAPNRKRMIGPSVRLVRAVARMFSTKGSDPRLDTKSSLGIPLRPIRG